MEHTINQNTEETGNPSCLWVVEKDPQQPSAKDVAMGKAKGMSDAEILEKQKEAEKIAAQVLDKREADKKAKDKAETDKKKPTAPEIPSTPSVTLPPVTRAPTGTGIDDGTKYSEIGFFFARRKDVNNCSVTRYQWGSPGFGCEF